MQPESAAMLLDHHLPRYDVTETHAVVIDADPDLTWQAVRGANLSESTMIRALKGQPAAPARPPLTIDDMARAGFLLLGERPGQEIVLGAVVQPWKAVTDDASVPPIDADGFASFATSGYVKVAFNIRVESYGSRRSLITTETRIAATDSASLRLFSRYWLVVGPASALIRRLMLRIVKSDAERRPGVMSNAYAPEA